MNSALYWILNIITCSLPIASSALFFWILAVAAQNFDQSITEGSVSSAFAAFPNYDQLLILLIIASTLIFFTTAIRNIQVRIWFRRRFGNYLESCCCNKNKTNNQASSTFFALLNDVGSAINILAYIFFLLLAIFPSDAPTESQRFTHNVATVSYFVLSIVYGFVQVTLTFKQGTHYPKYVGVIQLILVLASAVLALAFVVTRYVTAGNPLFVAEWLAVVCNLLFIGFFAVLFMMDSATDELVEFICPCCCGGGRRQKADASSSYRSMA